MVLKKTNYQAGTSEMFEKREIPQNEKTPFYPRSPYGVAKVYSLDNKIIERHNIFACNGILFNHESPVEGNICNKKNCYWTM